MDNGRLPSLTRALPEVGCGIVVPHRTVPGVRFQLQPMFSLSSSEMSFPISVAAVAATREGHEVVVRVTLAKEEVEGRFADTSRAALLDELDQWLAFLAHAAGAPKGLPLSMWARSTAALVCDECMKPRAAD